MNVIHSVDDDDDDDASTKGLGLTNALCCDYKACIVGATYPFSSQLGMNFFFITFDHQPAFTHSYFSKIIYEGTLDKGVRRTHQCRNSTRR